MSNIFCVPETITILYINYNKSKRNKFIKLTLNLFIYYIKIVSTYFMLNSYIIKSKKIPIWRGIQWRVQVH